MGSFLPRLTKKVSIIARSKRRRNKRSKETNADYITLSCTPLFEIEVRVRFPAFESRFSPADVSEMNFVGQLSIFSAVKLDRKRTIFISLPKKTSR